MGACESLGLQLVSWSWWGDKNGSVAMAFACRCFDAKISPLLFPLTPLFLQTQILVWFTPERALHG